MFLSDPQSNFNIIQPIPRFYTSRFGRRTELDDDNKNRAQKAHEVIFRPSEISSTEDLSSSILITGIRSRDWNFRDDPQDLDEKSLPNIKYQLIPSINNTIKNYSTNFMIDNNNGNQYEEYDLDEQDFQWLIAYNQFRIEKHLPELDENIFEYVMQLFEHQCVVAIRKQNYEDTIQCDACHRIDNVDDLIQCKQCKTIVHKRCYGIDENVNVNEWTCFSCQYNNDPHQCYICNQTGGALKTVKLSSNKQQQSQWVHLSCAFWTPKFEFDENMTPILKDTLEYNGQCSICNQMTGVKINCSWKNCLDWFHAKCAIHAGQDMFIAEDDDKNSIYLLALCDRHTEKVDVSKNRVRLSKVQENKQKRFEQFTSYINIETIKNQTQILPDVLESIHTYWVLKRQANNCRPLIDIPDDIFYHDYDKNINLIEFSRQHRPTEVIEEKSNFLQFLTTNTIRSSSSNNNLFVKFAQRHRKHFINYERNRFCLLDAGRKKQ